MELASLVALARWACTAVAAALKAHEGGPEFVALLADLTAQTAEAAEVRFGRPGEVLHKAAERLATRIEREHAAWLTQELRDDAAGRQDARAALAALPDVLGKCLPTSEAIARADLNPARIADAVVRAARADRLRTEPPYRADGSGRRSRAPARGRSFGTARIDVRTRTEVKRLPSHATRPHRMITFVPAARRTS